eukprot:403368707
MSEESRPVYKPPRTYGLPHGLERDPDAINQMLWKRKIYRKRVEKNESKKLKKQYIREKEKDNSGVYAPTEEAKEMIEMDPKKQEFYKMLFMQNDNEAVSDNKDMKQLKELREADQEQKERRQRNRDNTQKGNQKQKETKQTQKPPQDNKQMEAKPVKPVDIDQKERRRRNKENKMKGLSEANKRQKTDVNDIQPQNTSAKLNQKVHQSNDNDSDDQESKSNNQVKRETKEKKKKETFNKELDRIQKLKEDQLKKKEELDKARLKKIKEKQKYARKMNQKTKTGQPLMKNFISHYLTKVEKKHTSSS